MKRKPPPSEIFIHRENEGTRDEFLSVDEDLRNKADVDETRRVGRYALVEEIDVSTVVITTKRKSHKRK